jgi:hypothetical protein
MTLAPSKADEIQLKMRQIRCHLGTDVRNLVRQARESTDWRHYVRRYQWFCLAATAAAGYLLVPRGKPKNAAAALHGATENDTGKVASTAAGGLTAAIAAMAIRSAASAVVRHGFDFLKRRAAADPRRNPAPEESVPNSNPLNEAEPW